MKFTARDLSGREIPYLSLFVISVVVSMLFIMFYKGELLLQTEVLSESSLSLIKYRNSNNASLFLFVCKERLWVIPLLFLLSTTYLAKGAVYSVIVWYGTGIGALLAILLVRYGPGGIVLLVGAGIPQYILYIPALIIALMLSAEKRVPNKRFFMQLIILEIIVIIGCFLESYVNLLVLEKIINFLNLS